MMLLPFFWSKKRFRIETLVVLLWASANLVSAADAPGSQSISLADRILIASRLYSDIQRYFGHWKAIPRYDLDNEYARDIKEVLASDGRRAFDLSSMEFLASLQNGHSSFSNKWLRDTFGQRIAFYAYPIDGEWVVTGSSIADLPLGEIVTAVDGESVESFYERNRKYESASNERWRRHAFFEEPYLFPANFTITLKGGRQLRITRQGQYQWVGAQYKSIETSQRDGVAVLPILVFTPQVFEDSAVEYLKKLRPVKSADSRRAWKPRRFHTKCFDRRRDGPSLPLDGGIDGGDSRFVPRHGHSRRAH